MRTSSSEVAYHLWQARQALNSIQPKPPAPIAFAPVHEIHKEDYVEAYQEGLVGSSHGFNIIITTP